MRVLIVEDEELIAQSIHDSLTAEGYAVDRAVDGVTALWKATEQTYDAILLDIMLPEMNGFVVCQQLRQRGVTTPIMMVSAKAGEFDQAKGLDTGADDYITKPVRPKVFVSKVKALLKRSGADRPEGRILESNGVKVDLEKVMVHVEGRDVQLPKKEFELLVLLIGKPGKVFKRDEIYSQIWGNDLFVGDRTIDVHIRKLREKIGDERIKTIKGIGYKFDA